MDPKKLMLGLMMGLMPDLATATAPQYGTMEGDPRSVPKSNMEKLADGAATMAIAVTGDANPVNMVEIVEIIIT